MGEPDVIEFGSTRRHRRPWGWLAVALVPLSIGLTVAVTRQAHHRAEARPEASVPVRSPLLWTSGYGYGTYGDQLSFSLNLRNVSPEQMSLSQPVVAPVPGVGIISVGFYAGQDHGSASRPMVVMAARGTGQIVIQYTVDCSAVRSRWPYLGDITVRSTSGSASGSTRLSSTVTPAQRPSPLPCPMPSS